MIRSRAPLRISFGGGGSEIDPYRQNFGGIVLNATIDMYAYTTINTIEGNKVVFNATDLGVSESINNILELGTGSGYNAAIISELIPYGKLTTVERIPSLGRHAKTILKNRKNIEVIIGDAMTIKYKHPFDRIIITAEFLSEDDVNDMIDNLAASYSICIYPYKNILWRVIKCNDNIIDKSKLLGVRFVPVLHN